MHWLRVTIVAKSTCARLSTVFGRAEDPRGAAAGRSWHSAKGWGWGAGVACNPGQSEPARGSAGARPLTLPAVGEGRQGCRRMKVSVSSINLPPRDILTYSRGFLLTNSLTAWVIKFGGPATSPVRSSEPGSKGSAGPWARRGGGRGRVRAGAGPWAGRRRSRPY